MGKDSAAAARPTRSVRLVFSLARADLLHEWVMTLCIIFAITAVVAPLLILFGLKVGTIGAWRKKLMEDPNIREINVMMLPDQYEYVTDDWFSGMRALAEVGFVIPNKRSSAPTLFNFTRRDGGEVKRITLTAIPTGAGDPLLSHFAVPVPEESQCVLSFEAAEQLGVAGGAKVKPQFYRLENDGERVERAPELEVVGVLPREAGYGTSILVPLPFLERVQDFIDGVPVPQWDYAGEVFFARPAFDGLFIVTPVAISAMDRASLTRFTAFAEVREVDRAFAEKQTGLEIAGDGFFYFLDTRRGVADEDDVKRIQGKVRGYQPLLLPWIEPLAVELVPPGGGPAVPVRLAALAVQGTLPATWSVRPAPDLLGAAPSLQLLGQARPEWGEGPVRLQMKGMDESFELPKYQAVEGLATDLVFGSQYLAGCLRRGLQRPISFSAADGKFVSSQQEGHEGVRIFARTIDDVIPLRDRLVGEGFKVSANIAQIASVKQTNAMITKLIGLISGVGVLGCLAALVANLFGSVERKRKELGVFRLIGFPSGSLTLFPIFQGLLISLGALVLAYLCFQACAQVINGYFNARNNDNLNYCTLTAGYLLFILLLTQAVALLSSLLAARRVIQVDPAHALRDE